MAKQPKLDPALLKSIQGANQAYIKGDPKWFDFLANDAVVFGINQSEPYRGKAEYRKRFLSILTGQKRKMKVLRQDFQDMGDQAVAAQTLQITQEGAVVNVRQSVIWRKAADKRWEMIHLHTAMIGNPTAATPTVASAAAVKVLNEKIATVAAVLGVAQ